MDKEKTEVTARDRETPTTGALSNEAHALLRELAGEPAEKPRVGETPETCEAAIIGACPKTCPPCMHEPQPAPTARAPAADCKCGHPQGVHHDDGCHGEITGYGCGCWIYKPKASAPRRMAGNPRCRGFYGEAAYHTIEHDETEACDLPPACQPLAPTPRRLMVTPDAQHAEHYAEDWTMHRCDLVGCRPVEPAPAKVVHRVEHEGKQLKADGTCAHVDCQPTPVDCGRGIGHTCNDTPGCVGYAPTNENRTGRFPAPVPTPPHAHRFDVRVEWVEEQERVNTDVGWITRYRVTRLACSTPDPTQPDGRCPVVTEVQHER